MGGTLARTKDNPSLRSASRFTRSGDPSNPHDGDDPYVKNRVAGSAAVRVGEHVHPFMMETILIVALVEDCSRMSLMIWSS